MNPRVLIVLCMVVFGPGLRAEGLELLINGQPFSSTTRLGLDHIIVLQRALGPAEFEARLSLRPRTGLSDAPQIGSDLTVVAGDGTAIFKGEIVSIEPIYSTGGDSKGIVIRGFDQLHRLTRGHRTRTWTDMSDAEIVSEIAARYGLAVESGDPGFRSRYVFQNNQTDLEFLRTRAARIGYLLVLEQEVLRFVDPLDREEEPDPLILASLGRLVDRHVPGPTRVLVRGWDFDSKQAIDAEAEADAHESGPGQRFVFEAADELAEEPGHNDFLVFSRDELQVLARARLRSLVLESRTVEAEVRGNPTLKPGLTVSITVTADKADDSDRFNGKYFVTGVTHQFTRSGGYTTSLRLGRDADGGT